VHASILELQNLSNRLVRCVLRTKTPQGFWGLPECIWQGILSQVLGQRDIGRLDTACCSSKWRPMLLSILASTCLAPASSLSMSAAYYKWSILRGLSMPRIFLPSELAASPGVYRTLMKVNCSHLIELEIDDAYRGSYLVTFVGKYCTSLRHLCLLDQEVDEFALRCLLESNRMSSVYFIGGQLTGQGDALSTLPILSNLLCVQLRYVAFQEQLFVRLLSKLTSVEVLVVRGRDTLTAKGLVAAVRATPAASSYVFPNILDVSSEVYRVVAERGTQLKSLCLWEACVTDSDMRVVLNHCRALKGLSLYGCALLTSDTVHNIARYCPLMEDLDLDGLDVNDAALIYLVSKCLKLWGLSLPKSPGITDRGIECVGLHCKTLTHLLMYYNPPAVTAQTFPLFAGLPQFVAEEYELTTVSSV
jgi:hypothetical protein